MQFDDAIGTDVVAIIGAACRLPGAPDEAGFRSLLAEGRCAVAARPTGRWDVERFLHPRAVTEPGFSYSFAGAYLDAPFDFDPTVFGMSPREAAQMDPQQRLLLEVVWEALEDARIPPSSLAGQDVGVYVGASSLDHANLMASDPAAIESHFMTGNTLSVISNRLSYVFDWRGPSFTVDTACSSSLVAFSQAMSDLRSGRIDTAVVAGVNMLLTPGAFIGFSRASMLSPTGLCRPFSASGDGYVRGEGGVAIVLQRGSIAAPGTIRAIAVAAGINSDGRTLGIALPGLDGQRRLLERLYGEAGIGPDEVAFVEAHGTGTRVGDPIEAAAIGAVLGRNRAAPLPIGSVKSNIGHLEPASGAAGLFKAVLALESRVLPRTLHLNALNPHIDFEELNLQPAQAAVQLDAASPTLHAGVSSFGFGGTNAHVILASAPRPSNAPQNTDTARHLVLSAATAEALSDTARAYAALLREGTPATEIAGAVEKGRERMRHRAVAILDEDAASLAETLRAFADSATAPGLALGTAVTSEPRLCFVFSGNGAQSVGMGRTAYLRNAAFRARFDAIDHAFRSIGAGSVKDDMFDPALAERIGFASSVQRLIFAVQAALTHALRTEGVVPAMVLGHSMGEVAAAEAAGALTLEDAVRIIHARASNQERARGRGLMAVFAAGRERMEAFLDGFGREEIDIAADNGPSSVTLSGTGDAVARAMREARRQRIASRALEIEYPFHSRFLDDMKDAFLFATRDIAGQRPAVAMISTVTGEPVGDGPLDAGYWWRNIREPVLFRSAVEAAAAKGATHFLEIGPRPILASAIAETLKSAGVAATVFSSLAEADDAEPHRDPVLWIAAQAKARGIATPLAPRAAANRDIALPFYPWQRATHRYQSTNAALNLFGRASRHPLLGDRLADGLPEWRKVLDTDILPFLGDHQVDGEAVVAGSALLEMALAVGRELRPEGPLGIEDFDILQPLVLSRQATREVSVRHVATTGIVEISSRPRLGGDDWTLHGRSRLSEPARLRRVPPLPSEPVIEADAAEIYGQAAACGLLYGPAFRRALSLRRDEKIVEVALSVPDEDRAPGVRPFILHPASVDGTLHALFQLVDIEPGVTRAYLPIRFGRLSLFEEALIAAATIVVDRHSDQSLKATIFLKDEAGTVVAELEEVLLRSVVLSRADPDEGIMHLSPGERRAFERAGDAFATILGALNRTTETVPGDAPLMLRAALRAAAFRALFRLADAERGLDWPQLVAAGKLAPNALSFAASLAEGLVLAGLAEPAGNGVRLTTESGLPDPERILRTFAAEFPDASADLVLFGQVTAALDAFLSEGNPPALRPELVEQFTGDGIAFRSTMDALKRASQALADAEAPPRILIAEADARALVSTLLPDARAGRMNLTIAGFDHLRLERLKQRFPETAPLRFLLLESNAPEAAPTFDLALVSSWNLAVNERASTFSGMAERLTDTGALVVAHPPLDPAIDFVLGTDPAWFAQSVDAALPLGQLPTPDETRTALVEAGCRNVEELSGGDTVCFVARRPARTGVQADRAIQLVQLGAGPGLLSQALPARLRAAGLQLAPPRDVDTFIPAEGEFVALLDPAPMDDRQRIEAVLSQLVMLLGCLPAETGPHRLWLVSRGAHTVPHDPSASAIWSFARVAANEYPHVDFRLLDIAPGLPVALAAARLVDALAAPGQERETIVDETASSALRVAPGLPLGSVPLSQNTGLTLEFPRRGALDHFGWVPKPRVAPGAGEVEVEVLATGLNFRDVMLAMGLLDDDVLDDGMAGAVFGFECAGRVCRVGRDVEAFRAGDLVMGFARNAFASHVTAPSEVFMVLPEGVSVEAGAGIPVAFLTAWYGLAELARLRKGERVLIHGAAGGVGLAAIQIARDRGAKIIATVSTPDKRALVTLLGADEVYDSRSLGFADAIRAAHGGVDVVLNSLSGEAMRASLKCLKPFGRFVELGKRDYVANTELGLRPFRRNLTYFGVDLDQLLAHDPDLVAEGLGHLAEKFRQGRYTPLPFRHFGFDGVGEAFRLMQSAGHVGKIVLRPPVPADARVANGGGPDFVPENVQLVVGGTGGFGLETALWLAEKGARTIVVASRRGALSSPDPRVEALRETGCVFVEERVDAGDEACVTALVQRIAATHGPIGGIYHTAMVLQDGLIRSLDQDALARVLTPKVDGSCHLDMASRSQPVKHFVLFSSVSALVGNPGQGAYVAANAYLEGIARRRRAGGLPAIAIGWGAISDAGVLARDRDTAAQLERIGGLAGMTAAEALRRLGRILPAAPRLQDPVVYCARWQNAGMIRELPVMATPTFAGFFGRTAAKGSTCEHDLATLLAGRNDTEALKIVTDIVAGRIARILRLSVQEVDADRPFSEMGMDSLMALELNMSIEQEFGVTLPLVTLISVPNLRVLGQRLLQSLRSPQAADDGVDADDLRLIAMHGGDTADFQDVGRKLASRRDQVTRVM